MEVESLSCNNCGAPLEVSPTVNFATCAHCKSKLAIRRTGSAHYTEVLERLDERTSSMAEDLEAIRVQNELEQVDREWQLEREPLLERNQNGSTSTPGVGSAIAGVIGGGIAVVFGLFFLGSLGSTSSPGATSGPPALFSMFAVLFIIVGVAGAIYAISKAQRYGDAERDYQNRRAGILRRMNDFRAVRRINRRR